jgi:hypothetical protein
LLTPQTVIQIQHTTNYFLERNRSFKLHINYLCNWLDGAESFSEKPKATQRGKKFHTFYGTQRFITMFKRVQVKNHNDDNELFQLYMELTLTEEW